MTLRERNRRRRNSPACRTGTVSGGRGPTEPPAHASTKPRLTGLQGSVLVGVLWCVSLLALVVIGTLHSSQLGLRVVKNQGDRVQAYYLALAGVERAKALLYHDAADRQGRGVNYSGQFRDAPRDFREIPLGRGTFSVLRQTEGGATRFGISDEESRLNLNQASAEELARLPDLRPEIAAGLLDWRDEDDQVTLGGAEVEYYASLPRPYQPRNAPLQTLREVLMIRGVSPGQFLGEDANQNGLLDPEEDDGGLSPPPDNADGVLEAGWSGWVTVNSAVENVSARGETRVNLQSAGESELTSIPGITPDLAKAIVAYRGENRLESLADLLEVRAASPQGQNAVRPDSTPVTLPGVVDPGAVGQPPSPGNAFVPTGPPLLNEDLLLDIADAVTVNDATSLEGVVNLNTAPPEVLACLPGFDRELAQAVVSYRESAGYFRNVAYLLRVPGVTRDLFKQVAARVETRSETFRILSEGTVSSSGARRRIQCIVHVNPRGVETLAYREDL